MTRADEDRAASAAVAIESLRASGAHRVDPVRLRQAEAMARRAAGHRGEARRLMDDKLARLLTGLEQALSRAHAPVAATTGPTLRGSLLSDLLVQFSTRGCGPDENRPAANGPTAPLSPVDLKAVREHRGTWARLVVDQRLRQSLATVPGNAGPLNTHRLVHQALGAMHQASPAYLQRFISHVDALLWLDQSSLPVGAAQKKGSARNQRPR